MRGSWNKLKLGLATGTTQFERSTVCGRPKLLGALNALDYPVPVEFCSARLNKVPGIVERSKFPLRNSWPQRRTLR